ncbi:MAG: THUMP domain-containing protein [Bacteroidota bacterium]|nr:THUMP domain-containing protein [Bacteroidota bacterium]
MKGVADHQLFAKTLPGLEDVLASELLKLGARDIRKARRGVSFTGDTGFIYKANLGLRTALRILKTLKRGRIRKQEDLYGFMAEIAWEEIFDERRSFAIDAMVFNSVFTNSLYAAQVSKDAIVDRFRRKGKKRPNVDTRHPQVRIDLHISAENVTLSLDSSGDSLHKRGYREQVGKAPISEVLAAGIIQLSNWKPGMPFFDPMCGSGTFLIEAALIASNMAPCIYRKEFCFMNWRDYDPDLHEKIEESLLKKAVEYNGQIVGWDKDPMMIVKANANIKKALFGDLIKIEIRDLFRSPAPFEKGVMVTNPPYDKKLEIAEADWYTRLGDQLKKAYAGWDVWMITGNLPALKTVGLRTSQRIELRNGDIDSRLVHYQMFEGSLED